jgi:hypothetical protein
MLIETHPFALGKSLFHLPFAKGRDKVMNYCHPASTFILRGAGWRASMGIGLKI